MTLSSSDVAAHGYRSLFHGHPDATYLFDPAGNFVDCNEALVTLVGRTRAELMTISFAPIIHPAFIDVTSEGFASALAGETAQYLTRGIRPDGSTFDVDVTNIPLTDTDGTVIAVAGIARDVGHVQALSAEVERNATVMRMASRIAKFGGWSIDTRTGELYWSSELFRMLSIDHAGGTPPLDVAIGLYPEPHAGIMGQAVEACMTDGTPIDLESVIVDGTGHQLHVRTLGEAVRDDNGIIIRIEGGFFDITDVHTEREERSRLQQALDTSLNRVQDLICFLDREWRITFANTAALALTGITREEAYGQRLQDLFAGMATPELLGAYHSAMDDHRVGRARSYLPTFDVWLDLTAHPTDDGVALIFRDVSDDVAAEQAVHEAAEQDALQASLFTISSNAIFTYGSDRRISLWNQAAADLYDCPIDEAIGQLVDDLIFHDGPSVTELASDDLERTGTWSGTLRQSTRTGKTVIVNSRAQLISDGPAAGMIMASNTDITQIEADRVARQTVEQRLEATLDQIQDGLCFIDRDWRFTFVNRTYENFVRQQAKSLVGKNLWEEFPATVGTTFETAYRRAMEAGEVATARGPYAPLQSSYDAIAYPTEEGIAVYVRDITEQERNAQAMREADASMRRQAALLDAARDMIFVLSEDGRIEYANQAARRVFGERLDSHATVSASEALGVDDVEIRRALDTVLANQQWDGDFVHDVGSDRPVITDARWQVIRDDSESPASVLALHTDVTEDRDRELVRNRAQRLESLGTLAGGIAHDLNNVLTPILMSSQLLATMVVDENSRSLVQSVEMSARRGSEMIRQVLSFARGTDGTRAIVDPRDVLQDLTQLAAETLPKNVDLRVEYDELDVISGDSTQILQVLLNLLTNARDAMPDGGVLTVLARNETFAADHPRRPIIDSDRCLVLAVTDTGTGMDATTSAKIFEPFFTTKELGKGTGLGLATSLAIVRSHGGDIAVDSVLGEGTTFTVYLPVDAEEPAPALEESEDDLPPGRGELILVVDDEASIRSIVRETLHSHGYRTLEASHGREAIEVAEAATEPIALLFTDMMMPIMDGAATANYFFTHYPTVAVVAASGLAANGGVARATHAGVQFFVSKPFTTAMLLSTVRTAIDERQRGELTQDRFQR